MADTKCSAEKHGSPTAYRQYRCRCPETVTLMYRYRAKGAKHVDEVKVLRACEGERLWLNIRERTEAVRRLAGRGLSARRIGERLHMSERAVWRYVHKLRQQYVDNREAS